MLVGLVLALVSCSSMPERLPAAVPTTQPQPVPTDDVVCADLDAEGGTFYTVAAISLMSGDLGRRSVSVDIAADDPRGSAH
jgi:hypothetical protein